MEAERGDDSIFIMLVGLLAAGVIIAARRGFDSLFSTGSSSSTTGPGSSSSSSSVPPWATSSSTTILPGDVSFDSSGLSYTPPNIIYDDGSSSSGGATMLETFCLAIRDMEGKPGDLNYRNNNPGAVECSPVGYKPQYGNVQCVGGFAVFPTYAQGWAYLQALIAERAAIHQTWTIRQFFENYAPAEDGNDPAAYAAFVAGRCGVSPDTTLGSLFPS